jgi:hypothetical protein
MLYQEKSGNPGIPCGLDGIFEVVESVVEPSGAVESSVDTSHGVEGTDMVDADVGGGVEVSSVSVAASVSEEAGLEVSKDSIMPEYKFCI